jgi:hypothetical protein
VDITEHHRNIQRFCSYSETDKKLRKSIKPDTGQDAQIKKVAVKKVPSSTLIKLVPAFTNFELHFHIPDRLMPFLKLGHVLFTRIDRLDYYFIVTEVEIMGYVSSILS